MSLKSIKKPIILGILFLLPVTFLVMLYPSSHNYNALEIVKGDIVELSSLTSENKEQITLEDNITILGFLGNDPNDKALNALNLKELIYDKFKGFKRFQTVMIVSNESRESVQLLKKELFQYDELKYWHFVYGNEEDINAIFNSLRSNQQLNNDLSYQSVFVIDKERNQRGRLDDRENNEKDREMPAYGLYNYDCIKVAELKNKMSEDIRILFTEYRQKRKGNFNSSSRRADDLKTDEQE